jgi:hypothetical protein
MRTSYRRCFDSTALLFFLLCDTLFCAPAVKIGQNFTASTFGVDSPAIPPDANGAIGPKHFVEFINGRFAVFDKTNGQLVFGTSDIKFWTNAGVTITGTQDVTDPRTVYDPSSGRWFVSMVDENLASRRQVANRFLIAVSATSDPTAAWHGFAIPSSSLNYFADFPTLGIDSNGAYVSGDLFDRFQNPVGPIVVSIPKSSLLATPPSTAGFTSSGVLSYASRGDILQSAVTTGNATTPEVVLAVGDLGLDFQPHSTLILSDFQNSSGSLTLSGRTVLTVPAYNLPINPRQPSGTDNLDDGDARISAFARRVGDVLYATHAVEVDSRAAVRWYKIDAVSRSLLESGTISDPNLELFYPSIAANDAGVVVIGCNGTSESQFVSSYAVVGQPVNGQLTFGDLLLLKKGETNYNQQDDTGVGRWGDYSATSVDPAAPNRFWTIQTFPVGPTTWATQVTEIITGSGTAANPPVLSFERQGANLLVSWADAPGLSLQSTPSLSTPQWTNVAQIPDVTNGQAALVIPASGNSGFYRLSQQ